MKKMYLALFALNLISGTSLYAQGVAIEEAGALSRPISIEKSAPTTSIVFKLVVPQGEVLDLRNEKGELLVRPASTMKLFTGWMALQNAARSDEYLSDMLHRSDNAKADSTLRRLGGAKVMMDYYRDLGLSVQNQLKIVDGSGLSKSNRTTCSLQIELLDHIRQTADFERFKSLLASPGEQGTLDDRLLDLQGRLFGKTGTLRTTIALTGYIESSKGTVMFCVISEFFQNSWPNERARIDKIVLDEVSKLESAE